MRETIECLIGSRTHHLLILPGKLFSIRVSWSKKNLTHAILDHVQMNCSWKSQLWRLKGNWKQEKIGMACKFFLAKLASRPNLQFTFSLLTYTWLHDDWALKSFFFVHRLILRSVQKFKIDWLRKPTVIICWEKSAPIII